MHAIRCHPVCDVSASGPSCTPYVVTLSGTSVHETGALSATLAVNRLGRCRATRPRHSRVVFGSPIDALITTRQCFCSEHCPKQKSWSVTRFASSWPQPLLAVLKTKSQEKSTNTGHDDIRHMQRQQKPLRSGNNATQRVAEAKKGQFLSILARVQ